MGGIKYFANKEKRTVVAKIDNIQNDILAMLKKCFGVTLHYSIAAPRYERLS